MSLYKLNTQDKKDLDKFTKILAQKVAQVIIQARSGDKVVTKCKPNSSGTDWVNYRSIPFLFLFTFESL